MISYSDEDFEDAYNKVFRVDKPMEEHQDQDGEIENIYYYNPNIVTINEDTFQICQMYNNLEIINDKDSKEGNIKEETVNYTEENELKNIEIEIKEDKEDEMKEVKTVKEQKVSQIEQ